MSEQESDHYLGRVFDTLELMKNLENLKNGITGPFFGRLRGKIPKPLKMRTAAVVMGDSLEHYFCLQPETTIFTIDTWNGYNFYHPSPERSETLDTKLKRFRALTSQPS